MMIIIIIKTMKNYINKELQNDTNQEIYIIIHNAYKEFVILTISCQFPTFEESKLTFF